MALIVDSSSTAHDAVADIDRKNATRMRELVLAFGWPSKAQVGEEGAHAAWLLVQHADHDLAFQKYCLTLMEPLIATGEISADHYAYLCDRVAVGEHRPQRFGTQFGPDREPHPIEDVEHVDARRSQFGLCSMAEYRDAMRKMYGDPKQALPETS